MTKPDRDITGEVRRSSLNRLPALLDIDGDTLKEVAERVRQFDKNQSDETRQRKALEKVAQYFGQSTLIETPSEKFAREGDRRRELELLTLTAVAQAFPHEELRNTRVFRRALTSLGPEPDPTGDRAHRLRAGLQDAIDTMLADPSVADWLECGGSRLRADGVLFALSSATFITPVVIRESLGFGIPGIYLFYPKLVRR